MTAALSDRSPVSERMLRYRLNRKLILQGQHLFKRRGNAVKAETMFAVTDGTRVVQWLSREGFEALAREKGALQAWEEMV